MLLLTLSQGICMKGAVYKHLLGVIDEQACMFLVFEQVGSSPQRTLLL